MTDNKKNSVRCGMQDWFEYCAAAQNFEDILHQTIENFPGNAKHTVCETSNINKIFYDTVSLDLWKHQQTIACIEAADQDSYQADTHYDGMHDDRSFSIPVNRGKKLSSQEIIDSFQLEKAFLTSDLYPVFKTKTKQEKVFWDIQTLQGEQSLVQMVFDASDISPVFMPRSITKSQTVKIEHIGGSMAGFEQFHEALRQTLYQTMRDGPFQDSAEERGFSICRKFLEVPVGSPHLKITCPD